MPNHSISINEVETPRQCRVSRTDTILHIVERERYTYFCIGNTVRCDRGTCQTNPQLIIDHALCVICADLPAIFRVSFTYILYK